MGVINALGTLRMPEFSNHWAESLQIKLNHGNCLGIWMCITMIICPLGPYGHAHGHYENQFQCYSMGGRPLWPPTVPRLVARSSQSNPRGSGPEVLKRERGHVTAKTRVSEVGVFRALQPNGIIRGLETCRHWNSATAVRIHSKSSSLKLSWPVDVQPHGHLTMRATWILPQG